MAEEPEVDAVEQTATSQDMPSDVYEWWQKQLGRPVETLEPEPALH